MKGNTCKAEPYKSFDRVQLFQRYDLYNSSKIDKDPEKGNFIDLNLNKT